MSREAKIVESSVFKAQTTIKHYECFGWELLNYQDARISLTRETQNPKYKQLVAYEKKYESLVKKLKAMSFQHCEPISVGLTILLSLFFLVPGIIYLTYKIIQLKNDKEAYDEYLQEQQDLKDEIQEVLKKSRKLFFESTHNQKTAKSEEQKVEKVVEDKKQEEDFEDEFVEEELDDDDDIIEA